MRVRLYFLGCLSSACTLLSILLIPFSKKIRQGWFGRIGLRKRVRQHTLHWTSPPLWFHVASSGELEQCLPILEATLEASNHDCGQNSSDKSRNPIFLSYFSPSGKMAVELEYSRRLKQNINVPWDYADYSPLDLPFSVRGFLRLLRPQRLTIIQRELWPNLIRISTEKKIPQILLGVNFPKTRLWPVYHPCLCQFDRIGTIDGASKERLTIHNPSLRVEVTGNPRVDRVVSRKQMSQPSLNRQFKEGVFLAASLWPADFRILKDAISQILRAEPTLQLILVPHELDERFIKTICHWFERQSLSYRRWSEASNAWLSHLVVDEIGILAELYSISTIVFVGGSFHARVHSVLEPAVYGRPILTGPFIENSIEASELSSTQGLKVCKNAEEVASSAIGFLSSKDSLQQAEGALRTYIERGLHSGRRSAEFLKNASLVLEPA